MISALLCLIAVHHQQSDLNLIHVLGQDNLQVECHIHKLNRRSTKAAFIYYALAEQEQFEGYLACLQAPSIANETNDINKQTNSSPVWSPLC